MAQIETWYNQDLQQPVKVHYLDGSLFSHNGNGNRIGVHVFNNGEPVTLSGTVSGYVVTADGSTVPCTGSRSGQDASILIPAAAYQPGAVFITVFLTDGSTVTTLASVATNVLTARTGSQVSPGSVVQDWTQTINAAMQDVQTAADNLGGIVATPYASLTYPVPLGKYTYYNGNLYRCISAIAASEEFTAAHWTQVRLGNDVTDLKSALSGYIPNVVGVVKNGYAINQEYGSVIVLSNYSTNVYEIKPKTKYLIRGISLDKLRIGLSNTAFVDNNKTPCDSIIITDNGVLSYTFTNTTNRKYLYITSKTASYPNGDVTVCEDKSYNLDNLYDGFAIPEMFGAVGDGTTDDTIALQRAINYCKLYNCTLKGIKNKIYGITYSLEINPTEDFCMDFGGATIKALAGLNNIMININRNNNADLKTFNIFKNVVLDCDNHCGGIYIPYGFKFLFDELSIKNCSTTAFRVDGGAEVFLQNTHIHCVHGTSTGILMNTSDCHFSDIIIIDADIAIGNSGTNFYERVHAWNTANVQNTVFFGHYAGLATLVQCQCDTYETGYYYATDRRLSLTNCTWYCNTPLYDSANTPIIFKINETAQYFMRNISCVNCTFDALNTPTDFCFYHEHMINMFGCWAKGTINYFKAETNLSLATGVIDSGNSHNSNVLRYKDDIVSYDLELNISNLTIGVNPVSIGTIKQPYWYPKTQIVVPCLFYTAEWDTKWFDGYIFINPNNGIIQIKVNDSTQNYVKLFAKGYYELPQVIYNGN